MVNIRSQDGRRGVGAFIGAAGDGPHAGLRGEQRLLPRFPIRHHRLHDFAANGLLPRDLC